MSKTNKIVYFILTTIFFVIFDVYFSNLILNKLQDIPPNPLFDLIFIQNAGAAFSIFENSKLFLIGFSAAAILAIIIYSLKHINKASTITIFWMSMLISGIFCNMYERVMFGFVRDFFKLNFVNFPVFNISDIFINVSVFAIVIIIVNNEIINRRTNK